MWIFKNKFDDRGFASEFPLTKNFKKKIISLLLLHFQIPMRLIAICKYFVLFFKIIQV